ncbi:MAG: phosphate ABC transporter, permease protein PstA, partial [Candidatus Omnitrophota bacterium]
MNKKVLNPALSKINSSIARKSGVNRRLDSGFKILGIASTAFGLIVLLVLITDIFLDGAFRLNWDFFVSFPSRKPELAGILSAWVGTVWIMVLTAL